MDSQYRVMWTKHGSEDCPYEDENACVDAWVAVHREQLDRFTEKGLADLAAELPEVTRSTAKDEHPCPALQPRGRALKGVPGANRRRRGRP